MSVWHLGIELGISWKSWRVDVCSRFDGLVLMNFFSYESSARITPIVDVRDAHETFLALP